MSYQVLARKYRPASFEELEGQEHVLRALVNALENNRLHHAYLFTGTRGVGKTTIARILARCLNCEKGISATPCGTCGTCLEIAEGRSVDLIEVDAASRTKVEDTRELLDNVQYMPSHNRFKVYLIDEVHMLSTHSFNALLKTLEEPPEHVKFLLATTDPKKLPVTVLSRCLQFNLKNLSPERVVSYLQQILPVENIAFEEAALWLLGRAADGSMRDALSLTDQAISFGNNSVTEADVKMMLGSIDQREVYDLLDGLIAKDGKAVLEKVSQLAEHAPDYSGLLAEMLAVLHRIALAQAVPGGLDNSQGDKQLVQDLAKVLDPEDVQLYYQIGIVGQRDLPYAPNLRVGFEMILLRMLSFTHLNQGTEPEGEKKNLETGHLANQEPTPVTALASQAPATTSSGSASLVDPASQKKSAEATSSPEELNQLLSSLKQGDHPRPDVHAPGMGKMDASPPSPEDRIEDDSDLIDFGGESDTARTNTGAVNVVRKPNEVKADSSSELPKKPTAASEVGVIQVDTGASETSISQSQPTAHSASHSTAHSTPHSTAKSIPQESKQRLSESSNVAVLPLKTEHWVDVLASLGLSGVTQSVASNCCMTTSSDTSCTLLLDKSHASLWNKNHESRIQSALAQYYQQPIELKFEVGSFEGETPAQIEAQRREAARLEAVKIIEDDTNVKKLIESFGGTLDIETITARRSKNGS